MPASDTDLTPRDRALASDLVRVVLRLEGASDVPPDGHPMGVRQNAQVRMRTDRLTLRPWEPDSDSDVRAAFDIYRRAAVVEWLGRSPEPWASVDATRERLRRWAGVGVERPGLGLWAVVPDAVGQPVGTVLLVPLPGPGGVLTDDIEIGWHLHPHRWGHGYATEAARAVLEHAFSDLGLSVVNAVAYEGNEASFAVMRRLGMTKQGSTDRWYDTLFEWWTAERPSPTGCRA